MAKFRILYVIRPAAGGMKKHLFSLVKWIDKDLFEVSVACPPGEMEEIKKLGIEVLHIPLGTNFSLKNDWRTVRMLVKFLRDRKITIMHSHSMRAGVVGRLASILAGTPIIITTAHNSIFYNMIPRWMQKIFALTDYVLSFRTDRIITVSTALRKEFIGSVKVRPERMVTIYGGIDATKFMQVRKTREEILLSLGITSTGNVVGTIARLAPQKGLKYFIEAASVVAKDRQVSFVIVGDGPLLDDLKRLADSVGLKDKMVFAGAREDIPEVLSVFDVFVLSSVSEGLGMVILEAMAAGKPVIATNVGGVSEIIQNGRNGILVPPCDVVEMARAIGLLLGNKDRAAHFGAAGRELVMEQFTETAMVRKTQELYLSLLRDKNLLEGKIGCGQ